MRKWKSDQIGWLHIKVARLAVQHGEPARGLVVQEACCGVRGRCNRCRARGARAARGGRGVARGGARRPFACLARRPRPRPRAPPPHNGQRRSVPRESSPAVHVLRVSLPERYIADASPPPLKTCRPRRNPCRWTAGKPPMAHPSSSAYVGTTTRLISRTASTSCSRPSPLWT